MAGRRKTIFAKVRWGTRSERSAPQALRGSRRFYIQKNGFSNFFRALRCAPPRTHQMGFPKPMRRGRDLLRDLGFLTGSLGPIGSIEGSLLANFVSLVAAGNVNSSQLAIVGSIYALSPLFRWVNAYSNKQSAPCAGCTWPWGGDQKPYCLTAIGTIFASVDCWRQLPSFSRRSGASSGA